MKFIGQFIQNFISRFNNDVYFTADDGTIASNLGLDSNNKLTRSTRPVGALQITNSSFTADIDTTKTYMAFNDGDSENTATNHVDLPIIAPTNGKLIRLNLRANQDL